MKISTFFYITIRSILNFFGLGQGNCLYYPSCGHVIKNSIQNKGFLYTIPTIFKRIFICNPLYLKFGKNWQF